MADDNSPNNSSSDQDQQPQQVVVIEPPAPANVHRLHPHPRHGVHGRPERSHAMTAHRAMHYGQTAAAAPRPTVKPEVKPAAAKVAPVVRPRMGFGLG